MNVEKKIYVCSCYDIQHQLVIMYDKELEIFTFQIHLTKLSFFKRLVVAIKYLFGFQSSIGAFEEVMLNSHHIREIRDQLSFYLGDSR